LWYYYGGFGCCVGGWVNIMVEVVFVVVVVMLVAVLVMVFMLVVLDFLSRKGKFITTYVMKRPEYNHYHHHHYLPSVFVAVLIERVEVD
jgi:hypothetical protein